MADAIIQDLTEQGSAVSKNLDAKNRDAKGWPPLVRVGGSVLLLCLFAVLITNREFYDSAMTSAFFALALLSAVIVHFRVRPVAIDASVVMLLALITGALEFLILRFHLQIMGCVSVVGISALLVMGLRTLWAKGQERKLMAFAFVPTLLFVSSEWTASTMLDLTTKLHPKTLDLFLYSFDCSLRIQFSFLMGQLLAKSASIYTIALLFYIALPLPIALVYAWKLVRGIRQAVPVMIGFLIAGPIGVLFYNIFPACGPAHLFGKGFPWHPLPTLGVRNLILEAVPVSGARNAIPSLHMAWILLVWWNSRRLPGWVRAICLLFVAWTLVATIGIGEHYFVDLVVAVPFALFVQALAKVDLPLLDPKRRVALLVGLLETLLWIAALSFAVPAMWKAPILPWVLIAVTVVSCLWVENELDNAATESA